MNTSNIFKEILFYTFHFSKTFVIIVTITFVIDIFSFPILKNYIGFLSDPPHFRTYVESNPVYGSAFKKNVRTFDRWGGMHIYEIVTNSLGFRDGRNREVAKKPEKGRIMFVGDSYTEGIGVNWPETFTGRLEVLFNEIGVDTLNAGMRGMAPTYYYLKTYDVAVSSGIHIDDIVVFIDISDAMNEAYISGEKASTRFDRIETPNPIEKKSEEKSFLNDPFLYIIDNSQIFIFGKMIYDYGILLRKYIKNYFRSDDYYRQKTDLVIARVTQYEMSKWTFQDAAYEKFGRRGTELNAESMEKLLDLARRQGIRMTIAIYPWPDQILSDRSGGHQARFWKQWAARHGVDLIDMYPAFTGERDPVDTIHSLFIPYDTHWNAAGHRVVARSVCSHFQARQSYDLACDRL